MAELPHNARSFGATQRYGDASRQALPRVGRNRLALQTVSSSVVLHAAGCTTFPRVSESEALNAEGTELAKRGALVEALYERALALDPSLAKAENNRGSVLRKLGRTEEARASFERALRLGSGRALPNLAAVLAEAGRFTDIDALVAMVDPAREADVWSAVSHATASFTESAAELRRARASTPEAFSNEAFRPCSSASSCARVGDEVLVSRDTRCLRVPGRSIVDGCELSHSSSSGC